MWDILGNIMLVFIRNCPRPGWWVWLILTQPRRTEIGTRFGVAHFGDRRSLLGQVDAVSVAVPTLQHREVVLDCLDAGVHVLVEKPLAVTPDEGRQMIDRARQKGLVLHVGHVERFNPVRDLVQALLSCPRFIECHRLAPFQPRGTGRRRGAGSDDS